MIAPAVESIDLFSALSGRSKHGVDEEPEARARLPMFGSYSINNTPNNTFVSRCDYRSGAMLLVDRARGTDGDDRPQEGQSHVKHMQLGK
jgi:hypothetical protein